MTISFKFPMQLSKPDAGWKRYLTAGSTLFPNSDTSAYLRASGPKHTSRATSSFSPERPYAVSMSKSIPSFLKPRLKSLTSSPRNNFPFHLNLQLFHLTLRILQVLHAIIILLLEFLVRLLLSAQRLLHLGELTHRLFEPGLGLCKLVLYGFVNTRLRAPREQTPGHIGYEIRRVSRVVGAKSACFTVISVQIDEPRSRLVAVDCAAVDDIDRLSIRQDAEVGLLSMGGECIEHGAFGRLVDELLSQDVQLAERDVLVLGGSLRISLAIFTILNALFLAGSRDDRYDGSLHLLTSANPIKLKQSPT